MKQELVMEALHRKKHKSKKCSDKTMTYALVPSDFRETCIQWSAGLGKPHVGCRSFDAMRFEK